MESCDEIAKTISKKFDNPITLEFENAIYFKFCNLNKKKIHVLYLRKGWKCFNGFEWKT